MKKTMLLWIIGFIGFLIMLLTVPSAFADVSNNESMLIYWTSDTNTSWSNASNYQATGGVRGTPTFAITDKMVGSGATKFDEAETDMVSFGGEHLNEVTNTTAGCWLNSTSGTNFENLFGRGNGANDAGQWRIWDDDRDTDNALTWLVSDADGDLILNTAPIANSVIKGGHKNLVMLRINQTGGTLYADGFINNTIRVSGSSVSAISKGIGNFTIGGSQVNSLDTFNNYMDECFYINSSLSSDEITHIWNNGTAGKTFKSAVATPADTIAPSANITNINASQSIKINSRLNITATLTDDIGLSKANITFNLTGLNDFYNFSFLGLSGTSAVISQNITVNLTRGNVINATVSVTDTAGNIAENSTLITIADTLGSIVIGFNATSLKVNSVINVSGNVTEPDSDIAFGMILNNQTGVMANTTFVGSGNTFNFSQAITITATRGKVINFTVAYNDTSKAEIQSSSTLYTIQNTAPPAPTVNQPEANTRYRLQPLDLNITITNDADSDSITQIKWWVNGTLNQTTGLSNTTLNVSDGRYNLSVAVFDGFDYSPNSTIVNFEIETQLPIFSCPSLINNTFTRLNLSVTCTLTDSDPYNFTMRMYDSIGSVANKTNSTAPADAPDTLTLAIELNTTRDGNFTLEINGSDSLSFSPKINDNLKQEKKGEEEYVFNDTKEGVSNTMLFKYEDKNENEDTLPLDLKTFSLYNDKGTRIIHGGNFTVSKAGDIPVFDITTKGTNIDIIKNSKFRGHLVFSPYGMDFDGYVKVNGIQVEYDVIIKRLSSTRVKVQIVPKIALSAGDFVEMYFDSIFGLNTIDLYYNLVYDLTKPQITNVSPINASTLISTTLAVGFNATETYSDKAVLRTNTSAGWAIRETIGYSTGTSNFTTLTGLSNGVYGVAVTLNDTVGNTITQNNTITVSIADTTPPTITLTSPSDNTVFTDIEKTTIIFRFSSNETAKNCTLFLNNNIAGNESKQQTLYNITVTNIDAGAYDWNATCYDLADNLGSSSVFSFEFNIITGGGGGTEQSAGGGGGVPTVGAETNLTEIITPINTGYTLNYLCKKIESFKKEKPEYTTLDIVSFQDDIRAEANTIVPILRLKGFIDNQEQFCGAKPPQNITAPKQEDERIPLWQQIKDKLNLSERSYEILNFDLMTPLRFFNVNLGTINIEDAEKLKFFKNLDIIFPLSVSDEITKNPNIVAQGIRIVPFIILVGIVLFGAYLLRNAPVSIAKSVRKFKFPELPKVEIPKIKLPEIRMKPRPPMPQRRPTFLRARVVTVPEQKVIVLPKSTPLKRGDSVVIRK